MKTTKHNITNTAEPIKPGYKKTKVGIIPEDWEVKKLGQCFKHLRTYTFSRNELEYNESEENIFNIHYGDIHSVFPNYHLNVYNDLNIIPSIINPSLNNPELLQNGDIIMADASEDYEGVGKSIELQNIQDKKLVAGTHTFALRPIFKIASYYGGYVFANWNVHKSLKRIATGISVYGLSKVNLAKIPLPIPPLPEQEAIADCLTTWDRAIEKQKKLINAKKLQKKGLMQQIFNGQLKVVNACPEQGRRGQLIQAKDGEDFTKEWKEVKLGDLGDFKTSSVNKIIEENEIKVKLLNYMDVYKNTHIDSKINYQITSAKTSQIESSNLLIGDVLFTPSSETPDDIGHSAVVIENLPNTVYSYHLVRFRPKKNIFELNFLGYIFNKSDILNEFSRRATGSTRYTLSIKDFKEVKTLIPSLEEQTAIAEFLQTADKEIELLEKQLTQLGLQKKGLMQVLLTGTKRLVES